MRILFKSENRATMSAVITVLAVLLVGVVAKSDGAAHLSDRPLGGARRAFPKRLAIAAPAGLKGLFVCPSVRTFMEFL
jgi:hypothetical protein